MKSNPPRSLDRLISAARPAVVAAAEAAAVVAPGTAGTSESAPPGFATRVAAHWVQSKPGLTGLDLWERVCWWGAGMAVASCLLAGTGRLQPAAVEGWELESDAPVSLEEVL